MKLNVIADNSGSVIEMGKHHLIRSLMLFVAQLPILNKEKYGAFEFRFYAWTDELREINPENPPEPGGSNNTAVLEKITDNILLLSDGYFSQSAYRPQEGIKCYCIAIGMDANAHNLAAISDNGRVCSAEDIHTVVD